jgi:hypothetical protein
MDSIKNEPVALAAVLAPIIVYLAAYLGFDVSGETAATIAGAVLVVGGGIARSLVRTKRTLPDPNAVKNKHGPPEKFGRQPGPGGYTPPPA